MMRNLHGHLELRVAAFLEFVEAASAHADCLREHFKALVGLHSDALKLAVLVRSIFVFFCSHFTSLMFRVF